MKVLSVRQPWTWLLVNGFKNVENRTKPTRVRGRVLIHASLGMTHEEYEACQLFVSTFSGLILPNFECLPRGGIVGSVEILDCVQNHSSEWFTGPYGYVMDDAKVLPFRACKGQLGFWEYRL